MFFPYIWRVLSPRNLSLKEDFTFALNRKGVPLTFIKYLANISDIFMINLGQHYFVRRVSWALKMADDLQNEAERLKNAFRDTLDVLSDSSWQGHKSKQKRRIDIWQS